MRNGDDAYRKLNKIDLALKDYKKAVSLAPEFTDSYHSFNAFRLPKLQSFGFGSDYALDADDASEYYHRGNAHKKEGKFNLAIKNFSQAIKIDPKFDYAYINRANVFYIKGQFDQAIKDYNHAIH